MVGLRVWTGISKQHKQKIENISKRSKNTKSSQNALQNEQNKNAKSAFAFLCESESPIKGTFLLIMRNAETRDRAGDLQIFSLTLSQLSYRGLVKGNTHTPHINALINHDDSITQARNFLKHGSPVRMKQQPNAKVDSCGVRTHTLADRRHETAY